MGTTNGIETSPDDSILYVGESLERRIWAFDLSPAGEISGKRLLHEFDDGLLDGMRCDVDGNLYVARFDASAVAVISPAGDLVREIPVGGERPTNVAFGGSDGRTCFVTVADRGWVEAFRVEVPGRSWALFHG